MRLPKRLPAALASLTLLAASSAQAGLPILGSRDAGQPSAAPAHHGGKKHVHLCAACAAKAQATAPVPAGVGCPTCGPMAPPSEAPGFAAVGEGAPLMMASGGAAPGYAIVGGTVGSSEPAPVGVMRTNYNQESPAPGSLGASLAPPSAPAGAPGYATVGDGSGAIPHARGDEVPPSLFGPAPTRRHHILSRVIGLPDFGRHRAEMEARRREAHAMTAYGPGGSSPTELPASMVYSGGAH